MPILSENTDRPSCLPGSKDEPFLPSIKTAAVSPRPAPLQGSSREMKQNGGQSGSTNSKGNTSSRRCINSTSNSNGSTHRSLINGDFEDENENRDKYFHNNNNNVNGFTDRNSIKKSSLNCRLDQYQSHETTGPNLSHKAFFSAPASESSTPFKLPSIDRSKSSSVSSLVSDRHLQHRHRQNCIRGQSRDRRSRLCRSPSCPSNLGCYWNDDDEDDNFDNDGEHDNESRAYNYIHNGVDSSLMITPDTARLPPAERLMGVPESCGTNYSHKGEAGFPPSSQASSRPCFGHREDSCTATNSSIKLPSIFPSRGSHNSSFLTTTSSIIGGGLGGGPDDIITADSSTATSRDGSPFAFKREPTFFSMGNSLRDGLQSQAAKNGSPSQTMLAPDAATKVAAKFTVSANGLSPRQEVNTERDDLDPMSSAIDSTRSSHHSYQQHNNQLHHSQHHNQPQHKIQQQSQQSTALLLPISSTADTKNCSIGISHVGTDGVGGGGLGVGKRKRKKNISKPSSNGLGDPASDSATERLLREKLGAIERRDNEGYCPTRESAKESAVPMTGADDYELSDLNLIERVKNETNERNGVNHGAREKDSKMGGGRVGGCGAGGGSGGGGATGYQSTPTRIQTEKKVASVKA